MLLLGIALSTSIFMSGRELQDSTNVLLRSNLPLFEHVFTTRKAFTEYERLLYEYYATTELDQMRARREFVDRQLSDSLAALSKAAPTNDYQLLQDSADKVHRLSMDLEQVLSAPQIDWDRSREILEQVSLVGRRAAPPLDQLIAGINEDVYGTADLVRLGTDTSTRLVAGFSALVLAIAGLVAFYVNRYLSESAERKRLAMYPVRNPDSVLTIDASGKIDYANPATEQLLESLDAAPEQYTALFPEDFDARFRATVASKTPLMKWELSAAEKFLSGSLHWMDDLQIGHIHIKDISEQTRARRQLQYQANYDELTGLANRRQFEETTRQLCEKNTAPFTIALVNLDRFNLVTAGHGFATGDAIIRSVAEILHGVLRELGTPNCQLYRFTGAGFSMLLHTDQPDPLVAVLLKRLHAPIDADGIPFHLTISVGTSRFPADDTSPDLLIQNADAALSRAITAGGDVWRAFDSEMRKQEQSWLATEHALHEALEKNELVLYYQPQVAADDGRLLGMETLIRWQSPERGMVPPFEFIPVAEQTGLIVEIGQWILQAACKQAKRWADDYEGDCVVAINISPRQFLHPEFLDSVREVLTNTGVEPGLIELEITEGVVMDNTEHCIWILQQLKDMGLQLSIDDFGTGYSSMSYLKRFNIDKLKIDRAFVMNLPDDKKDLAIVRTIIDLAHNLGLRVIAEGVETEAQMSLLNQQGCEELQGFAISRPKPATELDVFFHPQEPSKAS